MSDNLKQFVAEHRPGFDTATPSADLWGRIDAHIGTVSPSRISSRRFSLFKYLAFTASVIVIAVLLISKGLNSFSKKDRELVNVDVPADQPSSQVKEQVQAVKGESTTAKINGISENGRMPRAATQQRQAARSAAGDPHPETGTEAPAGPLTEQSISQVAGAAREEKKAVSTEKRKSISVPLEPGGLNVYSGTLYNSSALCQVLRAYKFTGKRSLDRGSRKMSNENRSVMKLISCAHLESMGNIKAVWLKGRTEKKLTVPVKEGFKNIVLVKKDGRELNPEAISHYYPGLNAISAYTGKYFNIVFNDQVDLILFFKDAEEGDKVLINGSIEAMVTEQP